MPTVTWGDTFEANPEDTDEFKYGANEIRTLKVGISERGELEHNFKTGTSPFHKAGLCSVLYRANTADITALANKVANGIYWDTTLEVFKSYDGANVVTLSMDHGSLGGLTDDDHTIYLHLDKANQTVNQNVLVTANVTIDGVDISLHAANDAKTQHTAGLGVILGSAASNSANTVYLAATDLLVEAGYSVFGGVGNTRLDGRVGATSPPTSNVATGGYGYDSGVPLFVTSMCFVVPKTYYWGVYETEYANTSLTLTKYIYSYALGS